MSPPNIPKPDTVQPQQEQVDKVNLKACVGKKWSYQQIQFQGKVIKCFKKKGKQ